MEAVELSPGCFFFMLSLSFQLLLDLYSRVIFLTCKEIGDDNIIRVEN